ncbi:MAG: OmpA family protein [Myxococcaceae bacterium]|nr:OmpA family protein [Myxococcaceae bacterium]
MRTLIGLSILFTACVTQGTYDQLKTEHETSTAQLKRELADVKAALDKERAKAKDLDAQQRDLQAKLEQLDKAYGKTKTDKSALESALAELNKRKEESEARIAEFKALLDKFKTLIDSGKLKVRIREGRMVVELATDILFPSGSATLSKDGKAAIAEVAQLLQSIPGRKFQIEGHTDNVPLSGKGYKSNWELASARALTVLHTMTEAGLSPERISAASYGDAMPAVPNDSPENKAANRRIEIALVPDLSSLPGFDELQRASK